MNIKYWSGFSKRKNSTKQPTGGTDCSVVLKEDTSILQPTFIVSTIPDTVNYIQAFGRYYFVTDITRNINGSYELHCTVDELASYKSQIGAATLFIERSNSGNSWISDGMVIPTDEVVQTAITAGDTLTGLNIYQPGYAVRTVGKSGIQTFLLSSGTITNALNTFFDVTEIDFTDVPGSLKSLFLAISNPGQYIKSIKWFPFDLPTSGSAVTYFGFTPTSATNDILGEQRQSIAVISKPAAYYNDWRDYDSRFTQVSIRLPGVGNVQIDPKYLQTVLSCTYDIDISTGEGKVQLVADQKIIGNYTAGVGIDIPFGGLSGLGALTSLAGIASGYSLNPLNFANNMISGAVNAVSDSIKPDQNVVGNAGNMAEWIQNPFIKCSVLRLGSTTKTPTGYGIPDMSNKTINTLSGFIKCSGASLDLGSYDAERDAINSYLNSGFYYE